MNMQEALEQLKDWDTVVDLAKRQAAKLDFGWNDSINIVLNACYQNPTLAPKNVKGSDHAEILYKWVRKFKTGYEGRISQRKSNPPQTKPDPIIDTIIKACLTHLGEGELENIKYAHRLSMSAENILGLLLEEYLAEQLQPEGWHCAWGETIRSVDFCHRDGRLLQVKNRSNSENSSSSQVRDGTDIIKWYRVHAQTGNYYWAVLNADLETSHLSEEAFKAFVIKVLANNPNALAIETDNPW